jgi:hypothetical protein
VRELKMSRGGKIKLEFWLSQNYLNAMENLSGGCVDLCQLEAPLLQLIT